MWNLPPEGQEPVSLDVAPEPRARGQGQAGYQPTLGAVMAKASRRRAAWPGEEAGLGVGAVLCLRLGVPGPPSQPPASPSQRAVEKYGPRAGLGRPMAPEGLRLPSPSRSLSLGRSITPRPGS